MAKDKKSSVKTDDTNVASSYIKKLNDELDAAMTSKDRASVKAISARLEAIEKANVTALFDEAMLDRAATAICELQAIGREYRLCDIPCHNRDNAIAGSEDISKAVIESLKKRGVVITTEGFLYAWLKQISRP